MLIERFRVVVEAGVSGGFYVEDGGSFLVISGENAFSLLSFTAGENALLDFYTVLFGFLRVLFSVGASSTDLLWR